METTEEEILNQYNSYKKEEFDKFYKKVKDLQDKLEEIIIESSSSLEEGLKQYKILIKELNNDN